MRKCIPWIALVWLFAAVTAAAQEDLAQRFRAVQSSVDREPFLMWSDGHATKIGNVDFSPKESRLLTQSIDGMICLWDVARGQRLAVLRGCGGNTGQARFSRYARKS